MDTSILHSRILEYKEKAKHPTSKEMILLFESWFLSIENYLSEIEMDNFRMIISLQKKDELIDTLCDIIIITGNADKLLIDPEDQNTKDAIQILLKEKDRKNHNSLSAISAFLYLNSDKKFTSLKQIKDYVG